jgi:hypothetical protein
LAAAKAATQVILEETLDPSYEPTNDEVLEYVIWLGMDLAADKDLFWIAREALKAPLPENWKPCKSTDDDGIYYFNFVSGESRWEHPCDEYYRSLYEKERKSKTANKKTAIGKVNLSIPAYSGKAATQEILKNSKTEEKMPGMDKKQLPIPAFSGKAATQVILEEDHDPSYEPTDDEVLEYVIWLGMDLAADKDLFWIAREALKAPLPENWKPCKSTDDDGIYYFNFVSGESRWEHPCDEYYRTLYEKERKSKTKKKKAVMDKMNLSIPEKAGMDKKKQLAKKCVDQLHGKEEKEKEEEEETTEKRWKSKVHDPAELSHLQLSTEIALPRFPIANPLPAPEFREGCWDGLAGALHSPGHFCSQCGQDMKPDHKFCGACGAPKD